MNEPIFLQLLNDGVNRALIESIAYITGAGVPGDLCEFGTMTGRTASVIAQFSAEVERSWGQSQIHHGIPVRKLHLFDSFQGLPAPTHSIDAQSPHVQANVWNKGILKGISADQLEALVQKFIAPDRIAIYEGFFSDTLPDVPAETRFALVHVDCDYYESTIQVLEHLFSQRMLSEGAVLLFDDWNCNRAAPEFGERRAWRDILANYDVSYSDEGGYSVFGHKFIIHGIGGKK